MTSESRPKLLVAVGKGSGSFEVWVDNKLSGGFEKISPADAHDHVVSFLSLINHEMHVIVIIWFIKLFNYHQVTGLAWAYNGNSLYSCSQVLGFHGVKHLLNLLHVLYF